MSDQKHTCRKCGLPMKPLPLPPDKDLLARVKLTITGWRCDCGHFNNLKRRKKP